MPNDWMDGYLWGYLHGLEQGRTEGWDAAEEQAAAVHARAYRIVQAHSRLTAKAAWEEEAAQPPPPLQPVLRRTTNEGEVQ